ncbi:MAG: hypothetical protein OQJ89_10545 [Kangiellaceae bacterium]|nr:hypothetical protein [Kangiellaceae bacterium]MCW9000883.1 hypothetical protein [Kangiellaceae bacterium]MCW9017394.1 hypothetical protein [Kangiellaceae bacterium]
MKNFRLAPKNGWSDYPQNKEIVESIYSSFMPLVNEASWNYMNFTSESGMFEDDAENSVHLEFLEDGENLASLCISIKIPTSENAGFLEKTMNELESKYSLIRDES